MSISKEEVLHIAKLAKLELSEVQLEKNTKDLSDIVAFAGQLNEIDVEGVTPTAHILDIKNVFREDVIEPSYARDEILKNAPEAQGGCVSVPKVVE